MLNFIKETGTEVKTAAVFAAAALVISVFTGLLSGISAGTVLLRALLALAVFACLGFGAAWVLKKFVPELLTGFSDSFDEDDAGPENYGEASVPEEDSGSEPAADEGSSDSVEENGGFSELKGSDFPSVSSTGSDNDYTSSQNVSMGKHIVSNDDNSFGYDPETMARAVRTMIKKDE